MALLVLLTAAAVEAGNEASHWVFFESKETGNGPRLELVLANGTKQRLDVSEDSTLISYLARGVYGRMESLSISMGDTNRALIKFDRLPRKVAKAELVLSLKLSETAPVDPFELALYPVTTAWGEKRSSWATQPDAAAEPVFSTRVKPEAGVVRWDVTAAVNRGAPHGWLLKVPGPIKQLEDIMPEVVSWELAIDSALERARKEKKLVLAFVEGEMVKQDLNYTETLLTAIVLADPDVHALMRKRFIPLRIGIFGQTYTAGVRGADPLKALGTRIAVTKPPALVVTTSKGKHIATLENIGTYSPGMVQGFLEHALKRHGKKRGAVRDPSPGVMHMGRGDFARAEKELRVEAESRNDEARYYLGCVLYRSGRRDEASGFWKLVGEDSPWRWKCQARLLRPERMAMFEVLEDVRYSPKLSSTERPAGRGAIERAAAWLASQQAADGSWRTGLGADEYQAAITALAAHALLAHGKDEAAVVRAHAWLKKYLEGDPRKANAWSAGYTLDFFLERMRRDKSVRKDAQRATDFVAAGQCPIGAWSYSRQWGVRTTRIQSWPEMPKGRYHSMNTGPSMVSLLRARDLGLEVDAEVLAKGKEALLDMRERPGVFTYTWPHPRNWNKSEETSIARAPACEHALFKLGATKKNDLKRSAGFFMKHRENLRRSVKITAGWTMPGGSSAYFFHFAYLHAALALDELGDKKARAALRNDLLQFIEADGTWVDWTPYGKHYATAAALLVLAK